MPLRQINWTIRFTITRTCAFGLNWFGALAPTQSTTTRNLCIGLNCLVFGFWRIYFSANIRLFSSYAISFNATFTAGPTPLHISSTRVYVSDGLLCMHFTFRLHQTIERLRQFIHLFTESNYLQTRKHYRICSPTVPSGRVGAGAVWVLSDLNLHNECMFK